MDTRRPSWTLSEAAERTGVSRSTVRRYREQGKLPNAYKDTDGLWKVPLEDLLAVGLTPREPTVSAPAEQASEQAGEQAASAELVLTQQRVRELESLLAVERVRAVSAETNAADLRMALRMLDSGRAEPAQEYPVMDTAAAVPSGDSTPAPTEPPARRRWWRWSS